MILTMDNCWVGLLEKRIDFYGLNFGSNSCIELGGQLSKFSQNLIEKLSFKTITLDQALQELDQVILSLIKDGYPVLKFLNEQSLNQCLLSVESNPSSYQDVRLVDSSSPEDCLNKIKSKIKLNNIIQGINKYD